MVFNAWVSAYTTENILNCFHWIFDAISRREAWKEKDTIIIFAIWINDSAEKPKTWVKRVTLDNFKKNITALIDICQQELLIQNVIFLWATNVEEKIINDIDNPCSEHFFYNSGIQDYNKVLQKLAEETTCSYIDVFWLMKEWDLEDGIHPSSQWHRKIYKKVLEFIEN